MDRYRSGIVHAEAAQGILAALNDVFTAKLRVGRGWAPSRPDLGRDNDLIALGHLFEMCAGDLFAEAHGVHVRGIEEIDPRIERDLEMLARVFLVHVPASGPVDQEGTSPAP